MGLINTETIYLKYSNDGISNTYIYISSYTIIKNRKDPKEGSYLPPPPDDPLNNGGLEEIKGSYSKYIVSVHYYQYFDKESSLSKEPIYGEIPYTYTFNTQTLDNIEQQAYQNLKASLFTNSIDDL